MPSINFVEPLPQDTSFMNIALEQAELAKLAEEIPVGAVVVNDNNIIASAFNSPIANSDPSAHAEVLAIRKATKVLGNYRLVNCTIYVSVEPCLMCLGTILNARIDRLVYGCRSTKFGFLRFLNNQNTSEQAYKSIEVTEGVLSNKCQVLLQEFFATKRTQTRS